MRRAVTGLGLAAVALGTGLATAAPSSAGGIGDLLSPAFGTTCANKHTGPRASGTTTHSTGTADGNWASLPTGGTLNQCGGADLLGGLGGGGGLTDKVGGSACGVGGAGGKYGDNAVGALIPGGESFLKPTLGPLVCDKPQPVLPDFTRN